MAAEERRIMAQAYVDSLILARDEAARQLSEMVADRKISYSIGGLSMSWTEYQKHLIDTIEQLTRQIQQGQSPFWVMSRARP